jgi:hypothetical protein
LTATEGLAIVTRTRSLLISLLTLGCLVASAASAQAACTKTWVGGGGKWGEENSWSPKGVPGASDEVCITEAGTYTVTLEPYAGELGHPANGDTVKSLTVGGPSGHQTLDIEGQSSISGSNEQLNVVSLTVAGGMAKINPTGTLMLDATASNRHGKTSGEDKPGGEATFAGTIENGGQIESQVEDSEFHNNLESGVTNESDGNIQVSSGALKVGYPNTYPVSGSNDGVVTVDPGASLQLISGDPSGVNTYENDGSVVNDGSVTVSGGEAKWTQGGGSVSGNEVVLENGATLADSAGTGEFLGNHDSVTVTGTIPAGQTVTVRGEPYNYGGELYNSTTLGTGGKELVNDGTLRLDPTGSGEVGGSVAVESGSIHNNGLIDVETETPTRVTQLLESLTNAPSGRLEVNGGVFQGNNGALTTNEGLVSVAPGALLQLEEAASFVNTAGGTFSPQIASASNFGAVQLIGPCCNGPGIFAAGGTLKPVLVGGFVPSAGQEVDLFELDGGKFESAFAAVANGFTADYSHKASEPAFVGVVYGTSAGGSGGSSGTGATSGSKSPPVVHLGSISRKQGKPTVTLSCPAGGSACQVVSIQATVTEHLKGGKITALTARKGKKKVTAKKKQVVIATGSASLAAGASKTLELTLNRTGNALLRKYGSLTAIVTVSSGGKTISTATVHWPRATKGKRK